MNIEELQKEAELTISHGVRYLRRDHAEAILKLIAVARAAKLVQQSDFPLIQIDATCDNLRAMGEALKALEESDPR